LPPHSNALETSQSTLATAYDKTPQEHVNPA